MSHTRWFLLAIGLGGLFVFAGCDKGPEQRLSREVLIRGNTSYADPIEQKHFREALASASIPHEVSVWPDGREYVSWAGDQDAAVQKVKDQLFGEPLPTGRHIRFSGELGDQFKAWLTANGIPFKIVVSRGKEYVVWEAQDSPRVAKWPHFPEHYRPGAQIDSDSYKK